MRKLSFKTKLLILCSFMSVVSLAIGGFSFRGFHKVEESYKRVVDGVMPSLALTNELQKHYQAIRINLRTLGLPNLSKSEAELAVSNTLKNIEEYEEHHKEYASIDFAPGEKELFEELAADWAKFKAIGARALEYHKAGGAENEQKLLQIFLVDCPEAAKKYDASIEKLLAFHADHTKKYVADSHALAGSTNLLIGWLILIGTAAGMGIGYWFSTSVSKNVYRILDLLGDNTVQVATASHQIASNSQDLSQSASEQASSLQETAASIEEMSSMVRKNSENAKNASLTSESSKQRAEEGKRVVEQMLVSIQEINESNNQIMTQVNQSNEQMAEIVRVIQEIGSKTKVINDIVFQTKLLSFNASVEAARAGEHGKGFAVVAEEVGNLATMSGNAAKEISQLLESSIQKVEQIVSDTKSGVEVLINQGKEKVESGAAVAKQCAEVLNQIVENVLNVTQMSGEISVASQEQAQGVQELTKAMHQLDQVTQKNASVSEEAAQSAEQLSRQAEVLKKVVMELSLLMRGVEQENAVPRSGGASDATGTPGGGSTKGKAAVVELSSKRGRTVEGPHALQKAAGESFPSQTHPGFKEV